MISDTERKGIDMFIREHSRPVDGGYVCFFGYNTLGNMWNRISMRIDGTYSREKESEEWTKKLEAQMIWLQKSDKREKKLGKLKKTSPLRYYFVMFLRKTANNLIY